MPQSSRNAPRGRPALSPVVGRTFLAAFLVSAPAACTKPSTSSPAPETAASSKDESQLSKLGPLQLAERQALPDQAREALHGRMTRHGDQLVYLVSSVLMLDYASTASLADSLASEPRLGRPALNEKDTLNALLPAAFFKYQDDLTVHARELADAARRSDDAALADTFSAVTKTCVGCHAVYLDDDLGFPLHDEHDEIDTPDDLCDADDPSCRGAGSDARVRARVGKPPF